MFKFVRYQALAISVLFSLGCIFSSFKNPVAFLPIDKISKENFIEKSDSASSVNKTDIYSICNLQNVGLSKAAFDYAIKGYKYLCTKRLVHKNNIITIIDYSQPSTQKRLYVLDIANGKILFNTLVAHGHNSGFEYATQFSNSDKSHQTSLGFYITLGTYIGSNGYSLKLQGCEKGFNDRAYKREIVLHGSDYVSENFINNNGFLGRSYGCPAVPLGLHKEIIDCIKDGSCLFLYHPTKKYLVRSKILNS